jgi:hypothetical protein
MSNPLLHDCCALNPLAYNIRSIKQRRIFDGGIQNQTEIMSCLLETKMMEKITLGQSNREEFLMVEFRIKLKSCHVCSKHK